MSLTSRCEWRLKYGKKVVRCSLHGDHETYLVNKHNQSYDHIGHIGVLEITWQEENKFASSKKFETSGKTKHKKPIIHRIRGALPIITHCPKCNLKHIDEGKWAVELHRTHLCADCNHLWRPATIPTFGVDELSEATIVGIVK